MKKILISLLGVLLILVAASAKSFAGADGIADFRERGCHEGGMPMMPPFLPPMMHHGQDMRGGPGAMPFLGQRLAGLDLDEKQRDSVREIESKVVKDSIRKEADIEVTELELRETLDKDSVDLTSVEVKMKKIESLRAEMHLAHIKAFEEIKSKLTPDQKKTLREILKAGPRFRHEIEGKS
jgi:Spy/CpxP family protein refolding chaperone